MVGKGAEKGEEDDDGEVEGADVEITKGDGIVQVSNQCKRKHNGIARAQTDCHALLICRRGACRTTSLNGEVSRRVEAPREPS